MLRTYYQNEIRLCIHIDLSLHKSLRFCYVYISFAFNNQGLIHRFDILQISESLCCTILSSFLPVQYRYNSDCLDARVLSCAITGASILLFIDFMIQNSFIRILKGDLALSMFLAVAVLI